MTDTTPTQPHGNIDEAILAIMSEVGTLQKNGKVPIGQKSVEVLTNDDLLAALKPLFIRHGVVVYADLVDHDERFDMAGPAVTPNGNVIEDGKVKGMRTRVWLTYSFRFRHVGSQTDFEIRVPGEGMGNDDKGTRKATTNAQKQAYILVFNITTGEPDPDEVPVAPENEGVAKPTRAQQQTAVARAKQDEPKPAAEEPKKPDDADPLPTEPAQPEIGELDVLKGKMRDLIPKLGYDKAQVDAEAAKPEVTGKPTRAEWINSVVLMRKVVKHFDGLVAAQATS